jgi:arylsulfatase A-like enzyme
LSWNNSEKPPNIVLILADDLGYGGIGCQGAKDIPTPHIDALAAGGVRMTSGYVTCPVCAPTRAGLLSGRYQQRFGFETNPGPEAYADPKFGLPRSEKTLAERLKELGYATGMFGKWHVGYKPGLTPTDRGFDEFFGFLSGANDYLPNAGRRAGRQPILRGTKMVEEPEYLTDAFGREAVSFIERHKDHPFFLYLPFNAVHSPLQADSKYLKRFEHIKDQKRRVHCAMMSAMDDNIGRVIETLRKHGLQERTLIIFLSDNGGPTPQTTSSNAPLRGYKGQVLEGGIRVPYIVCWKGVLPEGKVYDRPVSTLDVVPTVLAAAGRPIAAFDKLDGVDLVPYMKGARSGDPHEALYWRSNDQRAIRKGDWKLVRAARDTQWRLYHLERDIGEARDLSDREPARLKELQEAWNAWNAELKDPLWRRQDGRTQRRAGDAGGNVEAQFKQLDKNGDGKLSGDEFGRPRIFRQIDRDGDGFVTMEEAKSFFSGRGRPRE